MVLGQIDAQTVVEFKNADLHGVAGQRGVDLLVTGLHSRNTQQTEQKQGREPRKPNRDDTHGKIPFPEGKIENRGRPPLLGAFGHSERSRDGFPLR
jgi:hypothetical protein